jgi:hypothetical protein
MDVDRPFNSSFSTAKGGQSSQKDAKNRNRASNQKKRLTVDKPPVSEAKRYFGCRLCTSPLRSNHNTSRSGIRESVKKSGPPRRWIRL